MRTTSTCSGPSLAPSQPDPAVLVGAQHDGPTPRQALERHAGRMAVAVPPPYRHQRPARLDRGEERQRGRGATAVVRDLERRRPDAGFDAARERSRSRSGCRRSGAASGRRPRRRSPATDRCRRRSRRARGAALRARSGARCTRSPRQSTRMAGAGPASRRSHAGRVPPTGRDPQLADGKVGGEVRQPAAVIGVGVRDHGGVERADAEPRQRRQQNAAAEVPDGQPPPSTSRARFRSRTRIASPCPTSSIVISRIVRTKRQRRRPTRAARAGAARAARADAASSAIASNVAVVPPSARGSDTSGCGGNAASQPKGSRERIEPRHQQGSPARRDQRHHRPHQPEAETETAPRHRHQVEERAAERKLREGGNGEGDGRELSAHRDRQRGRERPPPPSLRQPRSQADDTCGRGDGELEREIVHQRAVGGGQRTGRESERVERARSTPGESRADHRREHEQRAQHGGAEPDQQRVSRRGEQRHAGARTGTRSRGQGPHQSGDEADVEARDREQVHQTGTPQSALPVFGQRRGAAEEKPFEQCRARTLFGARVPSAARPDAPARARAGSGGRAASSGWMKRALLTRTCQPPTQVGWPVVERERRAQVGERRYAARR